MSAPGYPQEQQQYAAPSAGVAPQHQQPLVGHPEQPHQHQQNALEAPIAQATPGAAGFAAGAPAAAPVHNTAAPAPAHAGATAVPAKSGPLDHNDVELWKQKFNAALADPSATIKSKSAVDAREWDASFCGCCSPIDTCCLTYCCPCITFGRTHHRINKSTSMQGYEPINTSCLLFLGAGCFGLHWIPEALQRSQIRAKYNLKGSFLKDVAVACCCFLCDLTQQEKESKLREAGPGAAGAAAAHPEQYKAEAGGMSYEQKV